MCAHSAHRPPPRYAPGRSNTENAKFRQNGHHPPYMYYSPPCPHCNPYDFYNPYNPNPVYPPTHYNGMIHEPEVVSSSTSTFTIVMLLMLTLSIMGVAIYRSLPLETRRRLQARLSRFITNLQNWRRRGNDIQNCRKNVHKQTATSTQLYNQLCCIPCNICKELTHSMSEPNSAVAAAKMQDNADRHECSDNPRKLKKVHVAAGTSEMDTAKMNRSTMLHVEELASEKMPD